MKPAVAIITNAQTPYRLHLHRRIAREIPEIELWSVFTHEVSNSPWRIQSPAEIRPVFFGQGESSDTQSHWRNQPKEWRKAGEILKWLTGNGVRCVVLFGYNDLGRIRILNFCKRRGVPSFLFGDSNILGDRQSGWKSLVKRALVGRFVRAATGMFYCGSLGQAYFRKYGARDERMFPFPYEPDYPVFERVEPQAVEAARRKYGLVEGRRYLIYSGRLAPPKRVDLLVTAFARIAAQRPEWSVIVAGGGALRQELADSIPVALAGRFIWTGFIGDAQEIAPLYRCADALVLPSTFEPWGVVVTEAAAASLALVCSSAVGAAAELVRDGVNGRVFESGNAASLEQALLDVTGEANIDRMKTASPPVLAEWRRRADPVNGLREALRFAEVLSHEDVQQGLRT